MNLSKSFIFFAVAVAIGAIATSCSLQTRVKRADKKFAIGEYYDAAEIYRNCYSRLSAKTDRSLKAQVAFRQGECYRILNNPRAITAYQHAVKYKYPDSIAYLRLAQVQQYQGKYKDAEKNYRIYLERHEDSYVAKAGVYACSKAGEWKRKPTRHKVVLAKDFAGKRCSDFSPAFIGEDADAIMFTSNRKQQTSGGGKKVMRRASPVTGQQTFSLYTSRHDASGKWLEIHLPDGLYGDGEAAEENTDQKNDSTSDGKQPGTVEMGVCCFTADGKTMYFTFSRPVNGQDLGTKIYRSERAGGEWGEPQEVKLFADSSISVGHPAVTAHGDTLYFVSDAPGGQGGKDIWRAEESGGQWINIVNMGEQINTSSDEMFPTVRFGGRLYFSSNGHPGYGGLDIFCAAPTGKDTLLAADSITQVSVPVYSLTNMGMPINSTGDDFGMTFAGKTDNGFFSSNRNSRKGEDQIYRFVLPEIVFAVEGKVSDNQGNPLSDGVLRLVGTDGTNQKLQIRRDGTYRLKLNPNVRYVMLATSRGHLNQKQELKTEEKNDSYTYTQDFVLAPVSKPVAMNNVFYEFGKWELTESSSQELMGLVKMLNDNPNITIELSAHTDMVGDSVSNRTLSEKRAQACVDFLIQNGIEKERLTPAGYGESKPVTADKTLHDKYTFIPVDQVLDETFILTLDKDKQDICNQINRRTEFRVLKTTYKLY